MQWWKRYNFFSTKFVCLHLRLFHALMASQGWGIGGRIVLRGGFIVLLDGPFSCRVFARAFFSFFFLQTYKTKSVIKTIRMSAVGTAIAALATTGFDIITATIGAARHVVLKRFSATFASMQIESLCASERSGMSLTLLLLRSSKEKRFSTLTLHQPLGVYPSLQAPFSDRKKEKLFHMSLLEKNSFSGKRRRTCGDKKYFKCILVGSWSFILK